MDELPPLPEPGFPIPDDRRAMARRFILQARSYLEQRDRLQAGEKARGRGRPHSENHWITAWLESWQPSTDTKHRSPDSSKIPGRRTRRSYLGSVPQRSPELCENQRTIDEMRETIAVTEEALPKLEALQQEAPREFAIISNTQLRRLRELTGNNELRIGDTSPTGFSLKHLLDNSGNAAAASEQ